MPARIPVQHPCLLSKKDRGPGRAGYSEETDTIRKCVDERPIGRFKESIRKSRSRRFLRLAENKVWAVEVNAHPWRLNLDWRWHQLALKYDCLMSINPDAHSIESES